MAENKLNLSKKYEYAWDKYSKEDLDKVFALSDRYKDFMSRSKTERECVKDFIALAEMKVIKTWRQL
jgi:hypothetical protein